VGLPLVSARSTLSGHVPLVAAVVLMVVVFAASGIGASRAAGTPAAATASVAVVDPIDGWLESCPETPSATCQPAVANDIAASIDGDLALARSAVGPDVVVGPIGGALRFEASGARGEVAEQRLTDAVASYESARTDLRRELEDRLALLPELAAFAATRTVAIEERVASIDARLAAAGGGPIAMLRAERAAAIASALDFANRGRELLALVDTTLAPAWVSTPVGSRLERLDELLGDAFWFAAGENAAPTRPR